MKRLAIFVLLGIIACQSEEKPIKSQVYSYFCAPKGVGVEYDTKGPAPIFTGLTDRHFPITTKSKEAQEYFNQGMMLMYGFNHPEAARSFHYASKLDPDCGMCYWGLAYVLGPNYNVGMDPEVLDDANEALEKAKATMALLTEKEQDMLKALMSRYPDENVEDRTAFDVAYSDEMRKLFETYPGDNDIAVLFAESLMDMHPWDLYTQAGEIKEWTPEILAVLETILNNEPDHPAANHLYIHAVEASNDPSQGIEAAKRLDTLVPGSGHLVHMPSHIYIRTGNYHEGTLSNIKAVEVDSLYLDACHVAGVYPLAYYPHNFHFLAATAALEGNGSLAIEASDRMVEKLDTLMMREEGLGTIQHYYTIPMYLRVKFQRWNEINAIPIPAPDLKYPQAIWYYATGLSKVEAGDMDGAKASLVKVQNLTSDEDVAKITVWDLNNCSNLVQIAAYVLEAKIAEGENRFDDAIASYKAAIAIEDELNYNEPPDWFFSVRHELAPTLIKNGQINEAIRVLEEDLNELPNNGWALHSLMQCYDASGNKAAFEDVKKEFNAAWAHADFKL